MNVTEAITSRRAVKKFDPAHRLSAGEIEKLFSLTIQAPTAFNIQNWRFVLVQDPELRQQIRAASFDQAQVTDGSLLVVLCADL
jgi:nitroreductase